MSDATSGVEAAVRGAIAAHLRWSPAAVRRELRLKTDLGLTLLDLIHLVLPLERRLAREAAIQGDFPVAQLVGVDTVGQLVDLFHGWTSRAQARSPW